MTKFRKSLLRYSSRNIAFTYSLGDKITPIYPILHFIARLMFHFHMRVLGGLQALRDPHLEYWNQCQLDGISPHPKIPMAHVQYGLKIPLWQKGHPLLHKWIRIH